MSIMILNQLRLEFGDKLLFETERLTIESGDVIGLIGKNGAGKTCLLRLLAGQLDGFSGQVQGQAHCLFNEVTLTEDVVRSGGEVAIASFLSTLYQPADLFLLDEPTTFLDAKHVDKVIKTIRRSPAAFCIATHDRTLLSALATKIWVIEQGKIKSYTCSYPDYLKERELEATQYAADVKQYAKEKKKLKQSVQSMKEKTDQKNGKPRKLSGSEYRLPGTKTAIASKQKKLQKAITQQENRLEQLKAPERVTEDYDVSFLSRVSQRPKRQLLIPAHQAVVEGRTLWKIPSQTLRSGDKLGIYGPNGSGKTTYLTYLLSQVPSAYKVGYFKQNQFYFKDEEVTVYDAVMAEAGQEFEESQIRTLLALLDFRREKVFRKIKQLSRGERVKVSLLTLLVNDLDVLVLDEITNFLDLKTLEAVEKVLVNFPGILVFVSHDRTFLKQVARAFLPIGDDKSSDWA